MGIIGELAEDVVTDDEFEEFMEAEDDSHKDLILSTDFGELLLIPTTKLEFWTRILLVLLFVFSLINFISFSYFLRMRAVD